MFIASLLLACALESEGPPDSAAANPSCEARGGPDDPLNDAFEPEGTGEDAELRWSGGSGKIRLTVLAADAIDYPNQTGDLDVTFDAAGTTSLIRGCACNPMEAACDAAEYVNAEATEGTITVQGTLGVHPNDYGGEYCCYGEVRVTFTEVLFGAADGSHIDAAVLDAFIMHSVAD
jgi:hypothetical protein